MDRLAQLLAQVSDLATLDDIALGNYLSELREAMEEAREGDLTSAVVEQLKAASQRVLEIRSEQDARAELAAELTAAADQALAVLNDDASASDQGDSADDAADDGDDDAGDAADGDAADGDAADGDAVDGHADDAADRADSSADGAPIAASGRAPRREVVVPGRRQVRARSRDPQIKAAAGLKDIGVGQAFANMDEVARAVHGRWVSLRTGGDGTPHPIATIDYSGLYDEGSRLGGGDLDEIHEKMAVKMRDRGERRAILASGGVPGPAEPRYEQVTFGTTRRPLRDALPSFLASRGKLAYNDSPVLSAIGTGGTGSSSKAIGTVTSTDDTNGATKNIQEIEAPTPTEVVVEAETMRFSQGNFAERFLPERTRAFLDLGQVAFARYCDALRLADIKAGSTDYTNTPAEFGAYRDLKRQFLGLVEYIRDDNRDDSLRLVCALPGYVPAMLAADLIAQQPGDDAWRITPAAVAADIRSWDPNVEVVFLLDSIRGRMLTTPTGQSPRTPGFDADVEWAMWIDGAWAFLDGGTLDLGVLRDATTSATNKFQTFYEQWEAVARILPETASYWVTSSLCAGGDSQVASDIQACSPQGS